MTIKSDIVVPESILLPVILSVGYDQECSKLCLIFLNYNSNNWTQRNIIKMNDQDFCDCVGFLLGDAISNLVRYFEMRFMCCDKPVLRYSSNFFLCICDK